ncbi:hypothetical protein [Nocardia blacklockiae]|uniref:hypothetical protein n=1 Tax=Nocardia blacklockiae TaxID=480036 RepID=UPI0018946331|nr:hypothetical protein [Nocardia blacklockiae]MBF6176472.1 hypothetical protein [Nocardia blacklockiae]
MNDAMFHWPLSVVAVVGMLLAAFVAINLSLFRTDDRRKKATSPRTRSALPPERADNAQDMWLPSSMHRPPSRTLTVSQAHREMQRHLHCSTDNCLSKAIAFSVLVRNGRIKPDSSRSVG